MKTVFSEEGDIRSVDVLAALVGLWREGASGALHFSRSGATAGFQLSAGELTSATSSDARFETAAILMRAGKLEAATMERLVTPQGGDRALAALHAGILTKREWRWGEKIRAVEVLSDLLTWIEGDYVFDRGAHAEAGEFRLTVPRLILELFLRSRDRGLILHYLGGADVPLARAPHFDSEFAAFGLTADAEAVVRLIDGRATAAHIASEGPAEPFAVEKLLAALVTLGLVYPEFVAPEDARNVAPAGAHGEVPQGAQSLASEGAPRESIEEAPASDEAAAAEVELSAEDVYAPEEPAKSSAPYSELDVPRPLSPSEETESALDEALDEDLGEPEAAAVEANESAMDDYAISESPDAPEPSGPTGSEEAEAQLEYESLHEPSRKDAADVGSAGISGPTSLEPESRSQLPLDYATGVGSEERPRPRSGARWLWLLILLAAGVGGLILLRGRGTPPPTRVVAARESPTPAPVPTGDAVLPSAMASPPPTEAVTPAAAAQPRVAAQPRSRRGANARAVENRRDDDRRAEGGVQRR